MISIKAYAQSVGIGTVQFVPLQMLEVRGDITINNATIDAAFRIANVKVLHNKGSSNLFAGDDAGKVNSGFNNTFVGYWSGYSNTTGAENTFVGSYSNYFGTTGSYNTYVGEEAGKVNNGGDRNVAVGFSANGAGGIQAKYDAVYIGAYAGFNSGGLGGDRNILIGSSSGYNLGGVMGDNVLIGYNTGYNGLNTQKSVFIGSYAGENNNSGASNVFIGYKSGDANISGGSNTFLGYQSGFVNTASSNTFIGYQSGLNNTSAGVNTFVGYEAGQATTTGNNNTFLGAQAGNTNSTGIYNTDIGSAAGLASTGAFNTLVGTGSAVRLSSGNLNTCIGTYAGQQIGTGSSNIYIGEQFNNINWANSCSGSNNINMGPSAGRLTSGSYNTFIGNAGYNTTIGSYNIFLGEVAGISNTTGDHNTLIGYGADVGAANLTNAIAIGAGAIVNASNALILGNAVNVGIGCSAPQYTLHVIGDIASSATVRSTNAVVTGAITACSDIRFKQNIKPLSASLENVLKLQGVNYLWKTKEFPQKNFNEKNQIGFIAQDIEKIYPEVVFTDLDGYKSVDYSKLTPVLVEAIKEQQQLIKQLQEQNQKLRSENSARDEKYEALIKTLTEKGILNSGSFQPEPISQVK